MPSRIEIIETDIFAIQAQAILTSCTPSLLPETPATQALHTAAGPKLAEECTHVAPCNVGEARITRGYNLSADFVIHTPTPIWGGGESGEDEQLANCYKNSFELATSYDISTLALQPLIVEEDSFPQMRATHIAMQEIITFLKKNIIMKRMILSCPNEETVKNYETAFDKCT